MRDDADNVTYAGNLAAHDHVTMDTSSSTYYSITSDEPIMVSFKVTLYLLKSIVIVCVNMIRNFCRLIFPTFEL